VAIKVRVGDMTIEAENETDLKAVLRALGHAPSTNGKSHAPSPATAPERSVAASNPVDSGSLLALYKALPDRQRLALETMAKDGGATDAELCAELGIERNALNGALMTLSKKARSYKLSLDHVLSSTVTRDRQKGTRVYTYRLTPEMNDAMVQSL
jgi:hypothetical protein